MSVKGYSNDRSAALRATKSKLDFVQSKRSAFNRGASQFLKERIAEIEEPKNRGIDFTQKEMQYIEEAYEATMKGWGLEPATNLPRQYRAR